jgi:hypothetical protein
MGEFEGHTEYIDSSNDPKLVCGSVVVHARLTSLVWISFVLSFSLLINLTMFNKNLAARALMLRVVTLVGHLLFAASE